MRIEKKGGDFAIHQRAYLENLFLEYDEHGKAACFYDQGHSRIWIFCSRRTIYCWAEPDDPTYQRQELGTTHPVDRISVRAMRVSSSPGQASMASTGQTSVSEAVASDLRVPDSGLWCRGAYDAETEGRRRASLGLTMSGWDRYMTRRGPRRDYGGTWVMMDSDGVHFVARDPGDGRGPNRNPESEAQGSGGDGAQPQKRVTPNLKRTSGGDFQGWSHGDWSQRSRRALCWESGAMMKRCGTT